jgi:hypothetical protein
VSVVALPISVSVEVGSVRVPVLTIVEITGLVNVLFVSVSVEVLEISVSVKDGNVKVNKLVGLICAMMGVVKVLLERVSEVALPISVSVLVGSVRVPVFTIDEITGLVNVLLIRVCVAFSKQTFEDK